MEDHQLKIESGILKDKKPRKKKSQDSNESVTIQKYPTVPAQVNAADPSNMILKALDSGRSMEEIEKLIKFRNDEIARLAEIDFKQSKAKFTGMRDRIVKSNEADFGVNAGGRQGAKYKYENLDDIDQTVKDAAAACGFSWDWKTRYDGDWIYIKCILSHIGGHTESDEMRGKADNTGGKNFIQAESSTNSYLMRYTLKKVLGLSTGREDNDGKGGAPAKVESKKNSKFDFKAVMQAVTAKKITFDAAVNTYDLSQEQIEALKIASESL